MLFLSFQNPWISNRKCCTEMFFVSPTSGQWPRMEAWTQRCMIPAKNKDSCRPPRVGLLCFVIFCCSFCYTRKMLLYFDHVGWHLFVPLLSLPYVYVHIDLCASRVNVGNWYWNAVICHVEKGSEIKAWQEPSMLATEFLVHKVQKWHFSCISEKKKGESIPLIIEKQWVVWFRWAHLLSLHPRIRALTW